MIIALVVLVLTGLTMAPLDGCDRERSCVVSGLLTMSGDGHGFIGKLTTPNGCLNVSIPDREARRLLGQEPIERTIRGRLLPYVGEEDIVEQRVNGRKIGRGLCGDAFLFVK